MTGRTVTSKAAKKGMEKHMQINEFTEKVQKVLMRELGEEYRVEIREVRKNNGIVMHGLMVLPENGNIAPTIYLDSLWEAYEGGTTFSEVMRRLTRVCREEMPRGNVNMEFFRCFEKVKERICYRLICRKGNEELLEEIPHVEFLDLAICFYYAYRGRELGEGTILIHNSHMENWGVDTAQLMRLSIKNTPRLFPGGCCSMADVLRDMMEFRKHDAGKELQWAKDIPMMVLTNPRKIYGAVCMLYPGLLERLARKEGKSLYILPSSVHEVILLPDDGGESPRELQRMIQEVNREHVAPEEVLSDNLYYFDLNEKQVKIIF